MGAQLKGHVNLLAGEVWNMRCSFKEVLYAKNAVEMHKRWCNAASRATICWILVGKQLRVGHDVIRVIAMMVWARRSDGDYQIG